MGDELDWVPPGVNTSRANVARVYDYLLGGTHNFPADREVGQKIIAVEPNSRPIGQANREFLRRAVRYLAGRGIGQFLDIGSGIPTQGNTHEVAQAARADARVAYVDMDPVAIAHSRALLAGRRGAAIFDADLHEPRRILADPDIGALIDFTQPVGLLLVAVLHFIRDEQDPWRIVATLREALVPGSYLVVSHGTDEGRPAVAHAAEQVYRRQVALPLSMRPRADILRFFDGFELLAPGLVEIPRWQPGSPAPLPGDPSRFWGGLAGVALLS
jgi:SAM-dependent methyltransferase